MKEAMYWHTLPDTAAECELCPHRCRIRDGRTGRCKTRAFQDGRLMALGYGRLSSAQLDPMEKKPLYHFHPGQSIFSIGGWGCSFTCSFCQNWSISQQGPDRDHAETHSPETIIAAAAAHGSIGIAYTYNEPLVNYEYVRDCCVLARSRGMSNVLVTNGFLNPEPAAALLPWVDALNVDIKSMDGDFYERQCGATLQPVLDFCVQARRAGCHLEITNLVIPTLNDQPDQLVALANWIREHLGENTPLHVSGYRPEYRLEVSATPRAILETAWRAAAALLPYVYFGNMLSDHGASTRCPRCKNELIRRNGYAVQKIGLNDHAACRQCGRPGDLIL